MGADRCESSGGYYSRTTSRSTTAYRGTSRTTTKSRTTSRSTTTSWTTSYSATTYYGTSWLVNTSRVTERMLGKLPETGPLTYTQVKELFEIPDDITLDMMRGRGRPAVPTTGSISFQTLRGLERWENYVTNWNTTYSRTTSHTTTKTRTTSRSTTTRWTTSYSATTSWTTSFSYTTSYTTRWYSACACCNACGNT